MIAHRGGGLALGIVRKTRNTMTWLTEIDTGPWKPNPSAIPGGLRLTPAIFESLAPVLALPTHGMGHATQALSRPAPIFDRVMAPNTETRRMP